MPLARDASIAAVNLRLDEARWRTAVERPRDQGQPNVAAAQWPALQ